jgi:hypothetical protein
VPVLATVLAAAVLLPVRGRLQRRVDRLFFGDRGARGRAAPGAGCLPGRAGRRPGRGTAPSSPGPARRGRADPGRAGAWPGNRLHDACGMRSARKLLNSLKTETHQAIADIRRIVYGLRPPALDELGLAGALHEQVARLERQAAGRSIAPARAEPASLPACRSGDGRARLTPPLILSLGNARPAERSKMTPLDGVSFGNSWQGGRTASGSPGDREGLPG